MRGILFKPDLSLANIELSKTRTSRTIGLGKINEYPDLWDVKFVENGVYCYLKNQHEPTWFIRCPYGKIGSELYGKETYALVYKSVSYEYPNEVYYFDWDKNRHGEATQKSEGLKIFYKVAHDILPSEFDMGEIKWRSPMMMPEWASRYHIILDKVDCQRIQSITNEDAIKEGITRHLASQLGISVSPSEEEFNLTQARNIFKALLDTINPDNWNRNLWNWVLYYHVILK